MVRRVLQASSRDLRGPQDALGRLERRVLVLQGRWGRHRSLRALRGLQELREKHLSLRVPQAHLPPDQLARLDQPETEVFRARLVRQAGRVILAHWELPAQRVLPLT